MHDKDWDSRVADDCMVPSQFVDLSRRTTLDPIQMLVYATLADAIDLATSSPKSNKGIRLRNEARAWIESKATYCFSFVWCCEALPQDSNWNPDVLRPRILNSKTRIRLRLQRVVGGKTTVGEIRQRSTKCLCCRNGKHDECTGVIDYVERRYRCWCKRCEFRHHKNSKSQRSSALPESSRIDNLQITQEETATSVQSGQGLEI